jgi:hypothetical protein
MGGWADSTKDAYHDTYKALPNLRKCLPKHGGLNIILSGTKGKREVLRFGPYPPKRN